MVVEAGARYVSIPRSEFFRFGRPRFQVTRVIATYVSIPRSEFFRFGLPQFRRQRAVSACFNSSIGILSVRTGAWLSLPGLARTFQFLDRNSFGSDLNAAKVLEVNSESFNSSIGILSVRTEGWAWDGGRLYGFQFLDRNSFGSDVYPPEGHRAARQSFNSSIGILSVRTRQRDCGHEMIDGVSIPRSEFFRFGHWRAMQCPS